MKLLSFDIEATGLNENDYMIEFAAIPFCTETLSIDHSLSFHHYINCPSFDELKPTLDRWVIDHNRQLIDKAHNQGLQINSFKNEFKTYLESKKLKSFFNDEILITLFGKSMNAIDLPFLNRDLGWDFMRLYFSHRVLDLSSVCLSLVNLSILPPQCISGSGLMDFFGKGEVKHTALDDAISMAELYLKILEKYKI